MSIKGTTQTNNRTQIIAYKTKRYEIILIENSIAKSKIELSKGSAKPQRIRSIKKGYAENNEGEGSQT